ncbi:MAG: hypothetical protein V6Z81_05820 [Parvularculales bacterium]
MDKSTDKPYPGSVSRANQNVRTDVRRFLDKVARTPAPVASATSVAGRGRLMFAMDATMSRALAWDSALQIQAGMFEETEKIGGLAVQLVWFRGFHEFRVSPWVYDATALAQTMTGVGVRGGLTQIERVLTHALDEVGQGVKINALVYVGDSVEEEADVLCDKAGQLGMRGMPLFVFQEGYDKDAESIFCEMARLSGGAWSRFDGSSIAQLRDLLTAVAVYATAGREALEKLGRHRGDVVRKIAGQIKQIK